MIFRFKSNFWKNSKRKLFRFFKWLIFSFGIFFTLILVLSFTTVPFWGIYSLAISESDFDFKPEYIVLMGGAGVPSNTALMRTYYTADLAHEFPKSTIIIALPDQDHPEDNTGHAKKMEIELRIRGVKNPVIFEFQGKNTRAQAIQISKKINIWSKIVLVSSPEHMYRAVKSFKKVGFRSIGGYSAFEQNLDSSLLFTSEDVDGKIFIPEIGNGTQLRYQFWNHLKFEIILLREYFAIFYYKIQGWI